MKNLICIAVLFICSCVQAQRLLPFDSLKLREAQEMFADDYRNVYLYKNKDFSLTKYDSLGRQKGQLMLTLPFKIQSVQNPMNIFAFSENAQELRMFDQNLVEIQKVNIRQKFGSVKMVFAEDLQQLWLLEESTRRLLRYNFREDRILNSYSLNLEYEQVRDLHIFDNRIYVLFKDAFSVYNLKAERIFHTVMNGGKRILRENDRIMVVTPDAVFRYTTHDLQKIFEVPGAAIVDKNSTHYFVIKQNKLYLYPAEQISAQP